MHFRGEGSGDIPVQDVISWIFDRADYDIEKPIYIDALNPHRSISWKQARTRVRQLAAGFHAARLQPGDCVCVHAFNDVDYSILVLGIIAAGGVFTGTNPSYTSHELTHHLRAAQSKFVITEPEMLDRMVPAATANGLPPGRIWVFHPRESPALAREFRSWTRLLDNGEADWRRFDDANQAKSVTAARLFSSGTTGLPKPAEFSHYNFIAQHTLVYDAHPIPFETRRILCLPFFHAAAAPAAHFTALRRGDPSFVLRRFSPEAFLTAVSHHRITECTAVPPIITALLQHPTTTAAALESLRLVRCGAAPLAAAPQRQFQSLLSPSATFTQVWGMTESTCVATLLPYPEPDPTGSVGRLLPTLEAKLLDPAGPLIPTFNTPGEICIRGPTIIPGYFASPAANAHAFDADGFYKTGDLGFCDAQSRKWYVLDRTKDLIKVRGFQVAPAEIEGVLVTHPRVRDVAVVGVFDAEAGTEYPRAYVVREEGTEGTEGLLEVAEVKGWVAERLAKYKRLDGGVYFRESIPRNASGKILKRALQESPH
ncbi:acetyl-CoA synthetase-like protein [Aspergillus ellipticus CBS 707.79]|uniref:Acetyl-CoA synthetase-like protein n=1 Tax=Aspergillus ellipticus CBS 707.79 TaxID=1448320 RepID=A0A319DLF7_9EURO|nr:acetyl-CoA synthetase-like protein [Aspergillus ellipticus CBS 707.79]